ncbi:hypothetical protein GCK32_018956, partial [Trichostrongylus colubriformis]
MSSKVSYMQSLDVSKHVKNLSVRYISTIMPTEHNLDDWIVLPLFQHGQDIPIDNDGRTAILVAHAPSLQRLLESWRERIENERRDRKERRRQQKTERREARYQKREEQRKRKQGSKAEPKDKRAKTDNRKQNREPPVLQETTNERDSISTDMDMHIIKKEEPYD